MHKCSPSLLSRFHLSYDKYGNKIDSISLLLNESVEVLFAPNGNTLEFTVSNPNIDMSNLDCTIDKETLRDLVISFKDAYNQIIANESEGTNS